MYKDEEQNSSPTPETELPVENNPESQPEFNPDDYLDKESLKRLGFGLWLSENRKNFLKIITIVLVLISALFFIISIYNLIVYFKAGDPLKNATLNNLSIVARTTTADLSISAPQIFNSGSLDDLAVQINNPNLNFSAKFNYCFVQGGTELKCGQDFILPGEEKYILALGLSPLSSESNISLSLSDIVWSHLDSKEIPDYNAYVLARLNFPVYDLTFLPAASAISDNIDLNYLEFSIKNNSPYNYYELPLNILIFRGEELAGVNRYVLNNFLSNETRLVKLSWTGDLRGAKKTLIVPVANILDEAVFLKYQGKQSN
jgi:hypothetical protein